MPSSFRESCSPSTRPSMLRREAACNFPCLFMCARLSCGRVPVLSNKREGVLSGLDLKFVPRKRRDSLCAVTPVEWFLKIPREDISKIARKHCSKRAASLCRPVPEDGAADLQQNMRALFEAK